jgi:mRNA interferase YafQ
MYIIRRSKDFETSVRRLKNSGIKPAIKKKIERTIDMLARGQRLPLGYKDHNLKGELSEYRECHIQNDLLLIYKIEKENMILMLIDLGSHSQLF